MGAVPTELHGVDRAADDRRPLTYVLIGLSVPVVAAAAVLLLWPRSPTETETTSGRSESYAVELTTSPRKGEIAASVRISRHDRAPVGVEEVVIDSVMPAMGHAMSQVVARKQEDRFEARGELFTMSGVWDVSLRVGDETVTVQLTVTG